MNKLTISALALVLVAGCCGQRCCSRKPAPQPKHVVAMIFDGLAGYTVTPDSMPTVCKLMKEGSWTMESRSVLPSSSSINWHSLFTCSASEQHGYISWDTKTPKFPPAAVCDNGLYPDIFYMLRQQRPEAKSYLCCEWDGILFDIDTNACTRAWQSKHIDTAAEICKLLKAERPAIIAACYNDPDHTGHADGWNGTNYVKMLQYLDKQVEMVVKTIKEAGLENDTVLIISADHGGVNKGHGGPSLKEMCRPFVAVGPGIKKDYQLKLPGTVYDDGATISALLGIKPHPVWIGRPHSEIFE